MSFASLLDDYRRAVGRCPDDHGLSLLTHDFVQRLGIVIEELRGAGQGDQELRDGLCGVREELAQSPFLRRLQTWPRGHPGDFETIHQLIRGEVQAQPGTSAYWFEALALNSPIARQHRNKIARQAAEIRRASLGREPARILVLACGGGQDVELAQETLLRRNVHIVLNDADAGALEFAARRLAPLATKLELVCGNALGSFRQFRRRGPFDLVLAGGLFDYLNARQAHFLASQIIGHLLKEGGCFFFSNIAAPNAFKWWMELCVDWPLVERSRAELLALLDAEQCTAQLTKDETGLTWMCTAIRAPT